MLQLWKKSVLCLLIAACLLALPAMAAGNLNVDCPDYSFTSVDGKQITPATNAGKTTLIVFAHLNANHGDAGQLIKNLAEAEWTGNPNLSVLVVDWMGSAPEEIRQFVKPYVGSETEITFCTNGSGFHSLLEAAGLNGGFSIPLSFVVDKNGKLQNYLQGESSENSFRNLLHPYVDGIEPVPMTTLALTGEHGYAEAFKIVELINVEREKVGLSAVKMDKELLEAAMLRAAECNIYYSHTRPDGTRCFTAFPNKGGSSGENIAIGQQSPEEVMTAWMNSQGHRANILSESFRSVGVGVFCHEGVYSWVQLFSSNQAITVKKPANTTKTAKITILQEHLVPRADYSQLMVKKGEKASTALYFPNREFDFQNVYPDITALTFHSDNPKVATVDDKGVITAVANGTAQITITLKGTNKRATVTVIVTEHNYQRWQYTEATCSSPGSARYNCEDCGEWIDKEIPPLTVHFWDSGTLSRKPTTSKDGEKIYTCTACGATKKESLPKYAAFKPQPTQPPTVPATKAPTVAPTVPATKAPTVPATQAPTVPATKAPTLPPTAAPTVPATKAPTVPPTVAETLPATQPVAEPTEKTTEPTAIPIPEPTEMPPELLPTEPTEETTEPMESSPEFVPETQPTQPATQTPTEPEIPVEKTPDNKLLIGVLVAVVATLAAGAFLIFWKRKK